MLRQPDSPPIRQWLESPLGIALLEKEQAVIDEALDGVFGEHLVQLGWWGKDAGVVGASRAQHTVRVVCDDQSGDVAADFTRLPFEDDSVDAVLLPHTLDLVARPHSVVREAHRVLRSEGHLMILGFKPVGLWGARRLLSRGQFPPGVRNVIGDRKLRDWLQLLDLRVQQSDRFFFRLPTGRRLGLGGEQWEVFGQRWWPELAACYWLQARKRVSTLTPLRPSWRSRARVVGGIAEPSLRDVLNSDRCTDTTES
ncbi:MAG: class I SAM-dependent methyltransferase [Woeseiaceae bacterium]